jgi:hypothetical protein
MMRDLESRQSMAAMHSAMAAALKAQHEGQQFDRARTPTDSLHPSSDDPQFGFAAIPWEIGANGLVRVRPLPTRSLHLLVKMARSSAEVAVPESPETTRVSVHLHAQ